MSYAVGLTGLIGSGKSIAASIFAKCAVDIIDTDVISHQLTAIEGSAIPLIERHFGARYLQQNGALDRNRMRKLVFADADARIALENILHPLIFEQVLLELGACSAKYAILVVPLLFKAQRYLNLITRSVFIDCMPDILIARTMARGSLTREQVLEILANQLSREQQLVLADDVIENNGTIIELTDKVKSLHSQYLEMFD